MSKKNDTIYQDDQESENFFDQQFIEEQFEDVLYEWRSSEKEE